MSGTPTFAKLFDILLRFEYDLIVMIFRPLEYDKVSIRHLGYPEYFGLTLTVFKVTGALVLIIPRIPGRAKEWAYAGFACSFIFAFVSHVAVDGFNGITFIPLYVFCFLIVSYVCYHKIKDRVKIFTRHAL